MQRSARELISLIKAHRNDEFERMLTLNADLFDPADDRWRLLLHEAAANDNERIIRHLIKKGFHVDSVNSKMKTPLMIATQTFQEKSIKALLDANASMDTVDANGKTVLQLFFNSPLFNKDVLKLFVERLQRDSANTDEWKDRLITGGIALFHAAFLDGKRVIEGLLERGYDINSKSINDLSALDAAIALQDLELAKWLIDRGADVNLVAKNGSRPLHKLIENEGQVNMVRLLLEHGANLNARNHHGRTPLCLAISKTYHQCVELLFEHGAILENSRIGKEPVLNFAIAANGPKLSKLLIAHLALLDKQNQPIATTVMSDKRLRTGKILSKLKYYYKKCKQMLESKIYDELMLFHFLNEISEQRMRILGRNKSLISEVKRFNSQLRRNCSLYFKLLKKRVSNATDLVILEDKAIVVLCELLKLNYNQFYDFARKTVGYLCENDLQQLCRA